MVNCEQIRYELHTEIQQQYAKKISEIGFAYNDHKIMNSLLVVFMELGLWWIGHIG